MRPLTFLYLDLKQSLFNFSSFFYLLVLPVGFYLLFGGMQDYGDLPFRDGNAAAYVMLGMAIYGAVVGAVSSAGTTVVEITSGWGRQLALTPLPTQMLTGIKIINALVTTALPVIAVNLAGILTQAVIPVHQQVICALITISTATIFAFYGSSVALMFKNARAVSVASGLLVFFSFFGTTFSPLPLILMEIARFTPMYGVTMLSRYPFTAGDTITSGSVNWLSNEPLGYALVNIAVWALIFLGSTLALRSRSTSR